MNKDLKEEKCVFMPNKQQQQKKKNTNIFSSLTALNALETTIGCKSVNFDQSFFIHLFICSYLYFA